MFVSVCCLNLFRCGEGNQLSPHGHKCYPNTQTKFYHQPSNQFNQITMNQNPEISLLETKNSKNKCAIRESLFKRLERILLIVLLVDGAAIFLLLLPYSLAVLAIDGDRYASETEMFCYYLPISIAWFCIAGLIILDFIKILFPIRKNKPTI